MSSHPTSDDADAVAAYPTAAGSHRLRYIPGSYKAWNPNDELEDMTPQELASHQNSQGWQSALAFRVNWAMRSQM